MRILLLIVALGLSAPNWADEVRLQENAPERHVVVKGDTLWDISEKFLKDPWRWPDVWQLNKEQIKNPHLIYPGDVVILTMENGKPRLSLESGARDVVKLSPQVRGEPIVIKEAGIPSIPLKAVRGLLSKGGVGDPADLERSPRILGSSDARVMFGSGDSVYASKGDGENVDWRVVRLGQPLKNPDDPKDILAYEMLYLGQARTEPKVVAALGGPVYAGTYMTLVLNKGVRDGLEEGHVLALFRAGRSVADPKCIRADKIGFLAGGRGQAQDCKQDENDKTALPDTRVGLAFVYRVFNKVAYALVMKGTEPVTVGDSARNP
jgi:hypothetical protein